MKVQKEKVTEGSERESDLLKAIHLVKRIQTQCCLVWGTWGRQSTPKTPEAPVRVFGRGWGGCWTKGKRAGS